MRSSSRGIDRIAVTFDEPTLVADAGLLVLRGSRFLCHSLCEL